MSYSQQLEHASTGISTHDLLISSSMAWPLCYLCKMKKIAKHIIIFCITINIFFGIFFNSNSVNILHQV